MSRLSAREAARQVSADGLRLMVGASDAPNLDGLDGRLRLAEIRAGLVGWLADLNLVGNALYERL